MIKQKFKVYGAFYNNIANGKATAQELPTQIKIFDGDLVVFEEFSHNGGFTGRFLLAKVTFVYHNRETQNGRQSFFSFKIIKNLNDRYLDGVALELAHQIEIDKQFKVRIKNKMQEIATTAEFKTKAQLETLLTIFDRKAEMEKDTI